MRTSEQAYQRTGLNPRLIKTAPELARETQTLAENTKLMSIYVEQKHPVAFVTAFQMVFCLAKQECLFGDFKHWVDCQ